MYTEFRAGSKRRPPLCEEAMPLQQRSEEASPLCREAAPLQQGDRHNFGYLKCKKLEAKVIKCKNNASKYKYMSNT